MNRRNRKKRFLKIGAISALGVGLVFSAFFSGQVFGQTAGEPTSDQLAIMHELTEAYPTAFSGCSANSADCYSNVIESGAIPEHAVVMATYEAFEGNEGKVVEYLGGGEGAEVVYETINTCVQDTDIPAERFYESALTVAEAPELEKIIEKLPGEVADQEFRDKIDASTNVAEAIEKEGTVTIAGVTITEKDLTSGAVADKAETLTANLAQNIIQNVQPDVSGTADFQSETLGAQISSFVGGQLGKIYQELGLSNELAQQQVTQVQKAVYEWHEENAVEHGGGPSRLDNLVQVYEQQSRLFGAPQGPGAGGPGGEAGGLPGMSFAGMPGFTLGAPEFGLGAPTGFPGAPGAGGYPIFADGNLPSVERLGEMRQEMVQREAENREFMQDFVNRPAAEQSGLAEQYILGHFKESGMKPPENIENMVQMMMQEAPRMAQEMQRYEGGAGQFTGGYEGVGGYSPGIVSPGVPYPDEPYPDDPYSDGGAGRYPTFTGGLPPGISPDQMPPGFDGKSFPAQGMPFTGFEGGPAGTYPMPAVMPPGYEGHPDFTGYTGPTGGGFDTSLFEQFSGGFGEKGAPFTGFEGTDFTGFGGPTGGFPYLGAPDGNYGGYQPIGTPGLHEPTGGTFTMTPAMYNEGLQSGMLPGQMPAIGSQIPTAGSYIPGDHGSFSPSGSFAPIMDAGFTFTPPTEYTNIALPVYSGGGGVSPGGIAPIGGGYVPPPTGGGSYGGHMEGGGGHSGGGSYAPPPPSGSIYDLYQYYYGYPYYWYY